MESMGPQSDDATATLTRVVAAASGLLSVGLFAAHFAFDSQLALAQGADSVIDALAAIGLALAVRLARQPPDESHPAGHSSAEPLAALGIATLGGVLAVQVAQRSIEALQGQPTVQPAVALLALFGIKGAFKAVVMVWTKRAEGPVRQPALDAVRLDARNDVLLSLVAMAGWVGTAWGVASLDAWLALPIAAWIGWSGLELGLENLRLLMGAAPDAERQGEITKLAESVEGVKAARAATD